MYSKLDQHEMFRHNIGRFRPRGGSGGYFAVRDAATPHWKRFFFD